MSASRNRLGSVVKVLILAIVLYALYMVYEALS